MNPAAALAAGRNPGLDLARAAAIGMVMAAHFLMEGAVKVPLLGASLAYAGRAGVELFFSLSGFLIGGLLIDLAEKGLSPRRVGAFLVRRWMRTLPLYYAVLLWSGWFFGRHSLHPFLLLQNFYPDEPRLMPVSWSLVMEEYFYLFFPAVMLALAAMLRGVRLVAGAALLIVAVCVTARLLDAHGAWGVPVRAAEENPLLRMDCAAYGVLAACALRRWPGAVAAHVGRRRGTLAACLLLALAWGGLHVTVQMDAARLLPIGFPAWSRAWSALDFTVLDVLFAVVVLALFHLARPARGPAAFAVRWTSLLSYSIYLVHLPVMVLSDYVIGLHALWAKVACDVGGSFLLAGLTYFGIERPFLALRDRIAPRNAAPARQALLVPQAGA